MIQIILEDGRVVIGVTRRNIDRLTASPSEPMKITLRRPATELIVVFGEDKPAILAQLEAAGLEFWDAHRAAAAEDPL